MLLQITATLLQITTMRYYRLRQFYQIITNYESFWCFSKPQQHINTNYGNYYKLRRYYKLCRNITVISINSLLVYDNKYYLQVYLGYRAYKIVDKIILDHLDENPFGTDED